MGRSPGVSTARPPPSQGCGSALAKCWLRAIGHARKNGAAHHDWRVASTTSFVSKRCAATVRDGSTPNCYLCTWHTVQAGAPERADPCRAGVRECGRVGERPLRTMATRPARVCIEFGLAQTRTVHRETCTVQPGNQKCPKWPGSPFQALVMALMYGPLGQCRTGFQSRYTITPEKVDNDSVAYIVSQVPKTEISNFSVSF